MTAFQLKPASGSTRRTCAALTLTVAGAVGACRDAERTTAPTAPVPDLALSTGGPGMPSLCMPCVPPDRILYVRGEWPPQGGGVIHRMKPDGTDDVTLGEGTNPAWSPTKTKIAFVYMDDIWVMNYDGTGRTQITHTPTWTEWEPSWSPDGQYIAYSRNQIENTYSARDVWTMKADGSDPVSLTSTSNRDERHPSWSPDGTKIALISRVDNNTDVFAIRIVTINPLTREGLLNSSFTTNATGWAVNPVWSPDGTKIAFTSTLGCGIAIQSVGSQTAQPFAPAGVTKCLDPTWSPNGLKLAFVVRTMAGGVSSITTASLNGTGLTYLTPGNMVDNTPAWHRN